jgi:hypothetical protein
MTDVYTAGDTIILFGIIMAFFMGAVFLAGLENPELCGSGNCRESNNFYLFFFMPVILGLCFIIIGMIFKLYEILGDKK